MTWVEERRKRLGLGFRFVYRRSLFFFLFLVSVWVFSFACFFIPFVYIWSSISSSPKSQIPTTFEVVIMKKTEMEMKSWMPTVYTPVDFYVKTLEPILDVILYMYAGNRLTCAMYVRMNEYHVPRRMSKAVRFSILV